MSTPDPSPDFLGPRPDGAAPMESAELDALFDALAAETVDRSPSVRDRLRELPSWVRMASVVVVAVVVGTVSSVSTGLRGDLGGADGLWLAVLYGGLGAVGLGATLLALRTAAAPSLRISPALLASGAVGLPLLMSVLPGLFPGFSLPASMGWGPHLACGAQGGLVAALVLSVVLLFERDDDPPSWRLLAASAVGGIAGFISQGMHCAANDVVHLVVGHGAYGLVLFGAATLAFGIARRR